MHNFRIRKTQIKHQTIDSIVSARPEKLRDSLAANLSSSSSKKVDGFVSSSVRRLDDFKRPEGLHPNQKDRNISSAGPESGPVSGKAELTEPAKKDSLLGISLPTGGPTDLKSLGRRKRGQDTQKIPSRWRKIRKWTLRSALALTVLVVLVGGFLFTQGFLKVQKVFKGGGSAAGLEENVTPELLKGEGDGRVNILMMGRGGSGHAGADLTDTIIVASIDPVNKNASLVSIPRDLWVSVSGFGSSKVNAVYANAKSRSLKNSPDDKEKAEKAGTQAISQTVSTVLGIPIHYYGMIDFEGFKEAVDIVGGVDINVPEELAVSEHLWDSTTRKPYYLNVPAGQQHFDSTKALYFARSRHTSKRGDFDRSERQRLFIQALGAKILSSGTYTNPVKISQLMSAFGDHISTDLSVNNALRLVELSKGADLSKLDSIGLADQPHVLVRTDNIDGLSIVRPTAGVGDYSKIQEFIRNSLRDPYLAKEEAKLAVLNGTNISGLAADKTAELKSYGYNVAVTGDAPTHEYTQTVLVDMTKGKKPFTKNYLEKRLGIKATTKLPDQQIQSSGADFVVILGQE